MSRGTVNNVRKGVCVWVMPGPQQGSHKLICVHTPVETSRPLFSVAAVAHTYSPFRTTSYIYLRISRAPIPRIRFALFALSSYASYNRKHVPLLIVTLALVIALILSLDLITLNINSGISGCLKIIKALIYS